MRSQRKKRRAARLVAQQRRIESTLSRSYVTDDERGHADFLAVFTGRTFLRIAAAMALLLLVDPSSRLASDAWGLLASRATATVSMLLTLLLMWSFLRRLPELQALLDDRRAWRQLGVDFPASGALDGALMGDWIEVWRSPTTWGFVFLALIPAYASLFNGVASEFYQSTTSREVVALAPTRERVQATLALILGDGGHYEVTAKVHDADARGGVPVSVDFATRSEYQIASGWRRSTLTLTQTVNLVVETSTSRRWELRGDAPPGSLAGTFYVFDVRVASEGLFQDGPTPAELLFGRRIESANGFFAAVDNRAGVSVLGATESVAKDLDAMRDFAAGLPGAGLGGYSRMLYLSAATITTVGYGDIVPTTDRARALVASEAVLGVVMMGLFLSTVGLKTARSRAP